MNKRHH